MLIVSFALLNRTQSISLGTLFDWSINGLATGTEEPEPPSSIWTSAYRDRKYYVHQETKKSSWSVPPELQGECAAVSGVQTRGSFVCGACSDQLQTFSFFSAALFDQIKDEPAA